VAALAAGAAVTAALASRTGVPDVVTLGLLAVLLLGSEAMVVRVRLGRETMALSLFEAILGPALLLANFTVLGALVIGAHIGAAAVHRLEPRKAAFNVAAWSLSAAVGSLVLTALPAATSTAAQMGALAVALTAMAAVNAVTFIGILRIVRGERAGVILATIGPSLGIGWAVNITFALLFAAAWSAGPVAIALTAAPLGALHFASRAHAAATADAHRLAGLHGALRALSGPGISEPIGRFLGAVREIFEGDRAELILVDGETTRVYEADASGARELVRSGGFTEALLRGNYGPAAIVAERAEAPLADPLRRSGHRTCLAVPIRDGMNVMGMMSVFDRSGPDGSTTGELAVLEALAAEAAGALARTALIRSLVEERRTTTDVLENASDGIVAIDRRGVILAWNPSMGTLTGHPPGEMIGRPAAPALLARNANGDPVPLDRWADPAIDLPADLEVTTRTGESRWVSCSYTRVEPTADRDATLIVIARDVTAARELDRMKEDFVATVSHELRTPLTPILGWADTLVKAGERLSVTERAGAAESILRQAHSLESLIVGLLEASRIQQGSIDLKYEPVDVRVVAERATASMRAACPSRTVTMVDAIDGPATTVGDATWLERIVCNLLSNADKYSPQSEPVIVRLAGDADDLLVEVTDRGSGIPDADRERIFERFQRLGEPLTRDRGGVGLGLYIAQRLAREHGGRVELASTPGAGSTFTLRLPASRRLIAVG
jgi:PAS domain S-box-containing protein